jgi:hypothetical protein
MRRVSHDRAFGAFALNDRIFDHHAAIGSHAAFGIG